MCGGFWNRVEASLPLSMGGRVMSERPKRCAYICDRQLHVYLCIIGRQKKNQIAFKDLIIKINSFIMFKNVYILLSTNYLLVMILSRHASKRPMKLSSMNTIFSNL